MLENSKKAFTLIELLVVIAIISLLVSILLPSLNKAKELAKQAVCSSNLRNLNVACNLYAGEYDSYLPAAVQFQGTATPESTIVSELDDYTERELWTCPSRDKSQVIADDAGTGDDNVAGVYHHWDGRYYPVNYTTNANVLPKTGSSGSTNYTAVYGPRKKLEDFGATETIVLFDQAPPWMGMGVSLNWPDYEYVNNVGAAYDMFNVHQEGVNAVFTDGSVAQVHRDDINDEMFNLD